eukprot:4012627-Alexandrium_andersonii.AAC.1
MQIPLLWKDNGVQRKLYKAGVLCQTSTTAKVHCNNAPMAVNAGEAKSRVAYIQMRLFEQHASDEFADLFDE